MLTLRSEDRIARWTLIVMTADRKTETEARAIAAQAVRDLELTERRAA